MGDNEIVENDYNFFALLFRLKYINRWSLMKNTQVENVSEHCFEVCVLAHALAVIENVVYSGSVNEEKTVLIALYHETAEALTGDLPTPIKYFNGDIKTAYKDIENLAENRMISKLPKELMARLKPSIKPNKDSREYKIVKNADKLAAYLKSVEEVENGNKDFITAKNTLKDYIDSQRDNAIDYFLKYLVDGFYKNFDELTKM